ncbi:MAG: helix-turn-helix domain-containing protein [Bacteroidales bacterium]|nr:helix-turn-helix domain-containing protein [Bacteroidales bacterium]
MKRLICVPEVPASQMVLTIITDEQLEAFADAVITKYQQSIARRKASEPSPEEWMTRKEVMTLLKRCDSTMTKWSRRGYLVPSMVGGKHLYRKADVMRILNAGRA